jgi:1,4-dihydroxy-2-naphthoate octaprenyltransferase
MAAVTMWIKALRVIPRISKEEWNGLDIISRWLIASRSAVFVMTAISCAIGALLAFGDGMFRWPAFLACFFGLVFAHAANNLINDFTDHKRGIDKDNYYRSQYGPQPLEHGLLTEKQHLIYIGITGLVAVSAGIYLVSVTGIATLYLFLAGAFFVLFYTWPLKYFGLGEPSVLLVWGPLMIGGTYYVVTGGSWSWDVVIISLVYAIGPTTVLFGKHTDKIDQDKEKGVHTLPVIIGEAASRFSTIGLWIIQYLILGYLIATQKISLPMVIVAFALYKFFKTSKIFINPRPKEAPPDLPAGVWPLYLVAGSFSYNRQFGLLFLLGLIVDALLKAIGISITL